MGVASQFYTPVCDNKVPSLVASLFSWRCLAASTSSFLHAAINLRPPSVTVSTHTSAFKAVAFQSPAMPNVRMSLCTQSVHSFSFPPRPLRTGNQYAECVKQQQTTTPTTATNISFLLFFVPVFSTCPLHTTNEYYIQWVWEKI